MKTLIAASILGISLAAGVCMTANCSTPAFAAAGFAAPAKIGEKAPEFTLKDTEGKDVKLADFKGKIVVLEWFNPGCPFVKKHHETLDTMTKTAAAYKDKGVVWLAVNSGSEGKQGAAAEENAKAKKDWKIEYPILLDTKGETGKAYGAKTTPHMFVIDKDGKLAYAGAIDNNSSPKTAGEKNYVKNAVDELLAGKKVSESETTSYGCNVKYGK
ncbi:MAG: thioredoxin family protein [Phycisphaerales bacterium]